MKNNDKDAPLPFAPDAPWLAPMAGFSDLAFRLLCRERGAAAAVTEMVSAKGLVYNSEGTRRLLDTCPQDAPLVVQLFGSQRRFIARAMDDLLERGFTRFDLNAGCPVRKVVKTGAGAALLQTPQQLIAVAKAMVDKAGPGRVGVKMRLGRSAPDETFLSVGRELEQAGVAWLALHPRYAVQGYSGRADWEGAARLTGAVDIPVLAGGDLFSPEDAAACLKQTGAAGVMFARGALGDPTIFTRFKTLLETGQAPPPPTGPALAAVIRRHAALAREYAQDARPLLKMRTAVPRYIRNAPGSRTLRTRLCRCSSWEELEDIIAALEAAAPDGGEAAAKREERT